MKRTLATVTAAALIAVPGVAAAAPEPINPAGPALQREIADDEYQPPSWMLHPPNHRHTRTYDSTDVIIGVTLVVGLVFLW